MKIKFVLLGLLILIFFQGVIADDNEEDELDDDIGEGLGAAAVGFSAVGFVYVLARRAQVYSKKLGEDQQELKDNIRNFYRQFRKPLLTLHNWVNIAATVSAVIHGLVIAEEELRDTVTGWIAAGAMILLTLSGILIWYRFKPIWDYRTSRTALRFVHRQWLFTIIFLVALLIHVA